jgi:hypothetical protein
MYKPVTIIVQCRGRAAATGGRALGIFTVQQGHTGRRVTGTKTHKQVVEWARAGGAVAHPLSAAFEARLSDSRLLLSGAPITAFRGCGILTGVPDPRDFGPPPPPGRTQTRYNRAGNSALYLADSEYGVRREMVHWAIRGTPYAQKFVIPVGATLRIANFTETSADDLITAVFGVAENENVHGLGAAAYDFSNAVADIVRSKFDGMRVPGCRGEYPQVYHNIVLFNPDGRWERWLAPGASPMRL